MKKIALTLVLVSSSTFANYKPIPDYERIGRLLEGNKEITSLLEMEKLGLNQGSTALDLWSGSYWPHFQGALASRYRDPSFAALIEKRAQFDKHRELSEKLPLYTYYGKENLLSPAEKYDLLVGDKEMTLTKYSWELGEKGMKFGKVPTWRGICDGWSSAAQMMPRPARSVTLPAADGTPITFYPEDIKALGSQLYARAQDNVIFLGKRCFSTVLGAFNGACDGTNPGAFHKALTNRVGMMKKSFNADLSSSSEVWNYPVKNYTVSYFNVLNNAPATSFAAALEVFDTDKKFKKRHRRHERTYAIVGVKVHVVFSDMRTAHTLETDGPTQDSIQEKTYFYDLELDRNYNILGGEWIGNDMPDFIWAPNDGTYPLANVELKGRPVTASEITQAAQTASKVGQPLSVIVEKLFELSK